MPEPEGIGTDVQRNRPWPVDTETAGFITYTVRTVHHTENCPAYRAMVTNARNRGATVHPVEWTTTGDAYARRRGICAKCWEDSGVRRA